MSAPTSSDIDYDAPLVGAGMHPGRRLAQQGVGHGIANRPRRMARGSLRGGMDKQEGVGQVAGART
ncbi:MAG TPA: hypothetical protein VGH56_04470 [Solirubrobacteraceae bacterium]